MNFQEVYARMNEPLQPSPALVEQVLRRTKHRRPWRRLAAAAIAAAILLATPAWRSGQRPAISYCTGCPPPPLSSSSRCKYGARTRVSPWR